MSVDPTAFPIEFDPREQRMRGRAVHGNTPFDVPFISQIDDNLWQGGCRDGLILPDFIEHVVSLCPWESYRSLRRVVSTMAVRMFDSEEQSFEQIDAIAHWVLACERSGPTLVHCQAGLNRSSLVVARALILNGAEPADAIARVRAQRSPACLCNPAFEKWLLS